MSDYITLMGAEDVRSAASSMRSAAEEMNRAAATIDGALREHRIFLTEWLEQYRAALEESAKP